jgi:Family of unknown function (DUF5716)
MPVSGANSKLNAREIPLGERLRDIFGYGFFRPLTRPSAAIYVDCADRLEIASDEGGQLSHEDAVVIIRDTLALYPRAELDADEGGDTQDVRVRAGKLFNQLLASRWLEDRTASLDERWVLISPLLRSLLQMLRELAQNEIAELKGFADILRGLCGALLTAAALDPAALNADEMRSQVNFLLEGVQRASDQMHAVEKVVLNFEERQRQSDSGELTLRLFYRDFYEGEHMVCYDTLRSGGLLPKLSRARDVVQRAPADPFAKERLADGLAVHKKLSPHDAYLLAEQQLSRLEKSLGAIRSKAELIDARVASFNKLSAQRYHYQTEMRGRRPELVKAYFAVVNEATCGRRFADLPDTPDFQILTPEVEVYYGTESLARARRARPLVNLGLDESAEGDAHDAQSDIRKSSLYALTPSRAARFIEKFIPERGMSKNSQELGSQPLHPVGDDELLDLLATLSFERAISATNARPVRWRIDFARTELGLVPEKIPVDTVANCRCERFTIERLD